MNIWYDMLIKPPLTPPAWLFSPVWVFLYVLIVISFILFALKITPQDKNKGFLFFWLQVLFNLLWTPAFFMLKSTVLGLFVIIILDILVFMTFKEFYKISKISAWLLVPYMLWIIFATYLNIGFVVLN